MNAAEVVLTAVFVVAKGTPITVNGNPLDEPPGAEKEQMNPASSASVVDAGEESSKSR